MTARMSSGSFSLRSEAPRIISSFWQVQKLNIHRVPLKKRVEYILCELFQVQLRLNQWLGFREKATKIESNSEKQEWIIFLKACQRALVAGAFS
ncbi:MAG: hypothetical protein CR997_08105 [Acidobacteria bacterium]|nr:MAG: hypothetical protein CR997_08105 [Acidobacteriota bacterium]